MVQQTIDSKFCEHGLGNTDNNLSTHDKQFPLIKKTALRDVQNENRIPKSVGSSPLSMDGEQNMNGIKVSGAKRPSSKGLMNRPVPRYESSTSDAPNSYLVYVRGKSEAEVGKLSHIEETAQLKPPQVKESTVSSFPASVPLPVAPPIISSRKPSVRPLGQSSTRFSPAESCYHLVGSTVPSSNPKGEKNMHWEEQYQLQILLKKFDEYDQDEYAQMLQSVSSVELSRHAIELEKRSIQLSLEEAKEVQRVAILNVLGKSLKNFKAPSAQQNQSEK